MPCSSIKQTNQTRMYSINSNCTAFMNWYLRINSTLEIGCCIVRHISLQQLFPWMKIPYILRQYWSNVSRESWTIFAGQAIIKLYSEVILIGPNHSWMSSKELLKELLSSYGDGEILWRRWASLIFSSRETETWRSSTFTWLMGGPNTRPSLAISENSSFEMGIKIKQNV